jgi:serine/threonine-protein kinase
LQSDPHLGKVIDGRFRIEERIGEGGMAKVFLATQLSMERRVALKVIREDLSLDPKVIVRFRREVEAVSCLRSPHVISFFDYGESPEGLLYIAMEYLQGQTLRDQLDAQNMLNGIDVIGIMHQVCAAVNEAHAAGISHRDLKPENIFFCDVPTPYTPFVKILDFGLAKLRDGLDSHLHITGQQNTVGTPAYIAPEMCISEREVDHRADLYALGVMVFEMLAGRLPFTGKAPMAVALAHAKEPIPSACEIAPHLPPGVDSFMSIALAKEPGERFQDAKTFAEALATALGDRRRR